MTHVYNESANLIERYGVHYKVKSHQISLISDMMQTTPADPGGQDAPIWLHLSYQAYPICHVPRDMSEVFPVPGWESLMGTGRDVKCAPK